MEDQIQNQKIKYFLYCRKSHGRKEETNSPSNEAQYKELMDFAKKEKDGGLEIIDVLKETHTAWEPGRPKFNEMMDRIERGEANGILIWEMSRLSRNKEDDARYEKLLKNGQLIEIRTPQTQYTKEENELMREIHGVMDRNYSKEISVRTKRGLNFKLHNHHEWPGWTPLGYVNIDKDTNQVAGLVRNQEIDPDKQKIQKELEKIYAKEKRKPRRIEIDPIKGPLVKQVFEDFATGNYSLAAMLDRMEENNLKSKNGKAISKSCLVNLLKNPFYYGWMKYKGEELEGTHKRLISKPLFDKVQAALKERSRPIKKGGRFAFTGLIKCGYCGCSITATKKKNKYIYYHCSHMRDRIRGGRCPQPAINEAGLKKQLGTEVKKVVINDMIRELIQEAMRQSHRNEKEMHRSGIKQWQSMYEKAEMKLNKLFDLYCGGSITKEEYDQRHKEIAEEKLKAKEYLDAHGTAQKAWFDYSENLIITTNHAYKIFEKGTNEEVKLLLSAIGKNYVLKDGRLTMQFKEPYSFVAALNEKSSNKIDWLRGQDSNL